MASPDIDALRMVANGNLGGAREHMNKMLEKQRERDIKDWIKDNVDLTVYDHVPLEPKEVAKFLDEIKNDLAHDRNVDPVEMMKDKLWDYCFDAYSDWELQIKEEKCEGLAETFGMSKDEARDWIDENAGASYPINEFLYDSYNTVIMLDTGDSNYDFILNHVKPAYNGDPIEEISDQASLVWLAEQNGYLKEEFIRLLQNIDDIPEDKHPFIHSVYENVENTSSSMNGVAFLGKMSLADLAVAQKEGVTVPKRTFCGLYDGWNGAASPFDIELQKDLFIPSNVTFSILPDCDYVFRYSVDYTCNFTNKVWGTQLFAGEAKEFKPEQIEQANAIFEQSPRIFAMDDKPLAFMQSKFAIAFRHNLERLGGIYDGMLDRGQFIRATIGAINRVSYETSGVGKPEYQFSEKFYRELQQFAPCKLPQSELDSYRNYFARVNGR